MSDRGREARRFRRRGSPYRTEDASAQERARASEKRGDRVVFTFVFAGHGDVDDGRGFLELEDGRFFREDLETLLHRVPAARAHVLLDACNSVYMLASRKPGGTRFATPEDIERSMRARLAHVGTFLSTSADAQVYEWSQIESGVFSHTVRSGLSGAADLDGDGRITYGELRAFVRIAAAGVPNPRFRPRIYARGPNGRDDEVLFEPRAAGAGRKLTLDTGTERRATVLDANEVPLVDVRLEAGFAPSLYLPRSESGRFTLVEREPGRPERRTEVALSEGSLMTRVAPAPSALASRSSGKPFDMLFAVAFGPRAVAALPPEKPEEAIYGVSMEDRERMHRLLDAAAEMQHDRRIGAGVAFGAAGIAAAGVGAATLLDSDTTRERTTCAARSCRYGAASLPGTACAGLNLFVGYRLTETLRGGIRILAGPMFAGGSVWAFGPSIGLRATSALTFGVFGAFGDSTISGYAPVEPPSGYRHASTGTNPEVTGQLAGGLGGGAEISLRLTRLARGELLGTATPFFLEGSQGTLFAFPIGIAYRFE